jgi:predicted MFS family arabinose efflux permease
MGQAGRPTLTRWRVLFFAAVTAVGVANLYYAQPLLHLIARDLHTGRTAAGAFLTLTQLGYATGLFLFLPVADALDRRRLVAGLLVAVSLLTATLAAAPSLLWLDVAGALMGLVTVVPQVVVPLAADLAEPERRGRTVGQVMAGLLVGVVGSRVVAGFVAQAWSWRTVYAMAAVLNAALAAAVLRTLPALPGPAEGQGFRKLVASLWELVRTLSPLRRAAVTGGALFGSFSAVWTTLTFHLSGPPFHYGTGTIGLFGLAGLAGAMVAPLVGRAADRRSPATLVRLGLGVTAMAGGLLLAAARSAVGTALGVLLLDAGAQMGHIANQARVYAQRPDARSRLNAVYMVSYFLGGSLGSFLGTLLYDRLAWAGTFVAVVVLLAVGALGEITL